MRKRCVKIIDHVYDIRSVKILAQDIIDVYETAYKSAEFIYERLNTALRPGNLAVDRANKIRWLERRDLI